MLCPHPPAVWDSLSSPTLPDPTVCTLPLSQEHPRGEQRGGGGCCEAHPRHRSSCLAVPSGGSEVARNKWRLLQFKALALVSRAGQGLGVRRQTHFSALMLSHGHLLLGAKVPETLHQEQERGSALWGSSWGRKVLPITSCVLPT